MAATGSGTRRNNVSELGIIKGLQTIYIYWALLLSYESVGVYVTKDIINGNDKCDHELIEATENDKFAYQCYVTGVGTDVEFLPLPVGSAHASQVMAQFLYRKKQTSIERFLILSHHDSVILYQAELKYEDNTTTEVLPPVVEDSVLRALTWAQWDPVQQSLYYIHYRKGMQSVEEEEQEAVQAQTAPTLSALQFHDDLPHETVLNIPLNLPQQLAVGSPCGTYEDDPIPLRVHDCSLDVTVIADSRGMVCICHHYLYQPLVAPEQGSQQENNMEEQSTVHFAYSVTLLHHGRVIHCTVPGVAWSDVPAMRPTFAMQTDQHLVAYAPSLFIHLLDIGPDHEPCCHIVLPTNEKTNTHLTTLFSGQGKSITVELATLNIVQLAVTPAFLLDHYHDTVLANKLAILHYFMIHLGNMEAVSELLLPLAEDSLRQNVPKILQEVLVGGAYASVQKNLLSDALPLVQLLPMTTSNPKTPIEIKLSGGLYCMTLTEESLWNPAVMLLSPRQRLMPYRDDLWTRLWDQLAERGPRFKPTTVVEKLMVSLVCYQPEALTRCSTPLSPGGALSISGGSLADLAAITAAGSCRNKAAPEPLPFYELETCTASKQEHVISVNLRELSMHLVKCELRGGGSPMQVHAVATRQVAAQLELSRAVCQLMTRSAGVNTKQCERGFPLVDELSPMRRRVLFSILERYALAVESLAMPLPQGFPSFFTYLGYRTLSFAMFLQYIQTSVLQLQVDAMKAILADLPDEGEGLTRKLRLLQLLPRSRAKRLLNAWPHPASLMLRAREHALNILSGVEGRAVHRHHTLNRGLTNIPSSDRLSPLDTFLDLLTAKVGSAS